MARSGLCMPASSVAAPAVGRLDHAVALGAERRAQELADLGLVLDHEDGRAHCAERFGRHRRRRLERQGEAERGADARQALGPDAAAVQLRRSRGRWRGPSRRAAVELLEDALEVALGQARAEVLDRHHELAAGDLRAQPDQRARRGVARRVLQQVGRAPARSGSRRRAPAADRRAGRPSCRCVARRSRRRRSTEPAISSSEPQSRSRRIAPLSRRVICSTLVTSSDIVARLLDRCSARAPRARSADQALAALGERSTRRR